MDKGHAAALLEQREGATRALADYKAGNTVNPFQDYALDGWRSVAWERQMQILVQRRECLAADHDRTKCCWSHDYHLVPWRESSKGIRSCTHCLPAATEARARIVAGENTAADEIKKQSHGHKEK